MNPTPDNPTAFSDTEMLDFIEKHELDFRHYRSTEVWIALREGEEVGCGETMRAAIAAAMLKESR